MFVLDMPPDVPPQYAPVVIAQTSQAQKSAETAERTIGICKLIENPPVPPLTAVNSLSPLVAVTNYFRIVEQREIEGSGKATLMQAPEYGKLKLYEETQSARYFPADPNYHGPDRATFLVEIAGYKVKVIYFFNVIEPPATDQEDKELCPKKYWKISLNPDDPNAPVYTIQHPYALTTPLAYTIQANLTVADLPLGALGQTVGTTITLDPTAAGFGWFIDPTPWSTTMRTVLTALGIDNQNYYLHESHFHINLRTPEWRRIDPSNNLLADSIVLDQTDTATSQALLTAAQALLAEVRPYLGLQGDVTMFVMDVPPDVPPQYAPVVIAEASQAKRQNTDRTIGVCALVSNRPEDRLSAVNSLGPVLSVWSYFKRQEKILIDEADFKAAKMTLLQAPEHGELGLSESTQSARYFATDPNYIGPDRATVLVEIGKYKVKVVYHFNVMRGVPPGGEQGSPYDDKRLCPNGRVWKISLNPDDPNSPIYTFSHPDQLTSPYAGLANVNLTFGPLAPGALGQTTGTTITLDPTAAGFGWFIDSTPWSNEEYLPTHDPDVWVASEKTGSERINC